MDVYKKLTHLNELYITAEDDAQLETISAERDRIIAEGENPDELYAFCLRDLEFMTRSLNLKVKLEPIFQMISASFISQEFFHKSRSWLYQRLNGNVVGGKRQYLSSEEVATLKRALVEISSRLQDAANNL